MSTQSKFVQFAFALPGNLNEALKQQVMLLTGQAGLIAAGAGLHAQAGFTVDAVPHDDSIDQNEEKMPRMGPRRCLVLAH